MHAAFRLSRLTEAEGNALHRHTLLFKTSPIHHSPHLLVLVYHLRRFGLKLYKAISEKLNCKSINYHSIHHGECAPTRPTNRASPTPGAILSTTHIHLLSRSHLLVRSLRWQQSTSIQIQEPQWSTYPQLFRRSSNNE